jgi:hypothetical protein
MSLFVTVSRGPRADAAQPVLASSDRGVVEAVLDAVRRLAERDAGAERFPSEPDGWRPTETDADAGEARR